MRNRILVPIALGLFATSAIAQGCFRPQLGTSLGAGPDTVFGIQPIGFTFPLAGTTYADIHVCDKGFVYLSNANVPPPGTADFSATAAELASGPPRVCALWSDIQVLAGNNGQCFLNSTPTLCTITWKNAQIYNSGLAGGPVFDLQMTLFPTGAVECVYGPGVTNGSIPSQPAWQVGVAGISPGGGVPLPAASDLSAGGATTDNTLYEQWLAPGTFDMAVASLQMIPTTPGWVFVSAPWTNCASVSNYGTGCLDGVGNPNSFYELMTAATFDLSGVTLSILRSPGGYIVLNSVPGTIVAPTLAAAIIADADDTQQTVALSVPMPVPGGATSSLTVCSNAFIALAATGNGTAFTPGVAAFLGWAQTAVAAWHDYNPSIAGSGKILFEEAGGIAYVTWDNVYSFATTVPSRLQFQFNLATGDITIVFGTVSASGNSHLVGYSYTGPSADPGPTDLSSMFGSLQIFDDKKALALATNGVPMLGNLGFGFVTSNVPPVVPLAFLFVGDTQVLPGLDLTFLGMPGCFGHTNANLTSAAASVAPLTGQAFQGFPIPNNPLYAGTMLTLQAVAFSLDTPLNLITSNGTKITIGY